VGLSRLRHPWKGWIILVLLIVVLSCVLAQAIPNGDPLQSGAATAYQSLTPYPGISKSFSIYF